MKLMSKIGLGLAGIVIAGASGAIGYAVGKRQSESIDETLEAKEEIEVEVELIENKETADKEVAVEVESEQEKLDKEIEEEDKEIDKELNEK